MLDRPINFEIGLFAYLQVCIIKRQLLRTWFACREGLLLETVSLRVDNPRYKDYSVLDDLKSEIELLDVLHRTFRKLIFRALNQKYPVYT